MPAESAPALSPEQWSGRDYRQSARELDTWAKQKLEQRPEDDATDYLAKLGLSYDDCVIVMNRAHVATVWRAADLLPRNQTGTALRSLADSPGGSSATGGCLPRRR